jgi:NAD(P)-dependent dehydrogenase (short-subunit alcohol dehydrogenase family)
MKHVIVSGANGSLGTAVVDKFLQEGYAVSGIVRSLKKDGKGANKNLQLIDVDLSNEAAAAQMVEAAIRQYSKIDVAVLTAGGFAMGDIKESSSSDILKQYKLNFETAYHLARPIFSQMMQQGHGRIFFIGGRAGIDASKSKGMTGYGLSKSLVIRLSELINEEARGTDVVSTVVIPGVIDTAPNRAAMPDADFSKWVQPSAIADVIYRHTTPEMSILRETVLKVYGKS